MKQVNTTLYSKNKIGKLQIWEIFTENNKIIVKHGIIGGKITEKVTKSEPKNIGKANETSAEQQANIEALAKYTKQLKSGYFVTKEEALDHQEFTPMKAQNYNDHSEKITLPVCLQPKLNGLRCLVTTSDKGVISKAGESYNEYVPDFWKVGIDLLKGHLGGDGEVFAGYQKQGGLSLQKINSAWKKHNENTQKLKYYIYDVPHPSLVFTDRLEKMKHLQTRIDCLELPFAIVEGKMCYTHEECDTYYEECLEKGAEGVVYRDPNGLYEYGTRSYKLIKRKPRQTAEAKVVSSKKDKNNWGVLTCMTQDGIMFECQMRVDAHESINYRLYENSLNLVDKFIEYQYEEVSDAGKPTKPVGVMVREVNPETWEPLE